MGSSLRAKELQALLAGALILQREPEAKGLFDRIAAAAASVIDAEITSVDAFDEVQGVEHLSAEPEIQNPLIFKEFTQHLHEHPFFAQPDALIAGEALKISDYIELRKLRDLGLYCEFFRTFGVDRQLSISIPTLHPTVHPHGLPVLALNRSGKDFSESDREVLKLLRPHIEAACRIAHIFAANKTPVCIDFDLRGKAQISDGAWLLIIKYYPKSPSGCRSLPEDLEKWVQLNRPDELRDKKKLDEKKPKRPPNVVINRQTENGTDRLFISLITRAGGELRLLLHEEFDSTVKARRQKVRQVLCVGEFKDLSPAEVRVVMELCCSKGPTSNNAIASICNIEPNTVRTHIQNILKRFGIAGGRTEIIQRVLHQL